MAGITDAEGAHAQARHGLHLVRDHDRWDSDGGRRSPHAGPLGRGSHSGSWQLRDRHLEARVKNGPALAGHGVEAARDTITRTILTVPEPLGRSLTWDRGAEMAQHARLKIDAGVQVYFGDSHSPWQQRKHQCVAAPVRPERHGSECAQRRGDHCRGSRP